MTSNHRRDEAGSSYSGHQPMTPNWMCVACGEQWPCQIRRERLLEQYARTPAALTMLLASALIEACADLPDLPAGELYEQFVGWLPKPG